MVDPNSTFTLSLDQLPAPLTQMTISTVSDAVTLLSYLKGMKQESVRVVESSQNTLSRLASQQAEIQRCISNLTAMVSPARQIPPELVRSIFEQCIINEPTHLRSEGSSQCVSLILGQICRGWRAIALTTSPLWSAFHVEIPQNIQDIDAARIAKLLTLWTSRSMASPLTIHLTIFPVFFPYRNRPRFRNVRGAAIQAVFSPIMTHSARWKDFRMDISFSAIKHIMKQATLITTTPQLQSFSINGSSYPSADSRERRSRPAFNFSSASFLRRFSLSDVGLPVYGPAFPWNTLEELTLLGTHHNLSLADGLEILEQCKRLRRCHLEFSCSDAPPSTGYSFDRITLPFLDRLHLTVHDVDVSELYNIATCPNLEELVVEYAVRSGARPFSRHRLLSKFISQCVGISSLYLRNLPIQEGDIVRLLKQASSVKALSITSSWGHYQPVGDRLLHALIAKQSPDQPVLLPRLEQIHLESRRASGYFISEFVRSRWNHMDDIAQLQQVYLNLHGTIFPEDPLYLHLAQYQRGGLKFTIE